MTTNTAILVIKSIQDRMWERMSSVECEAFGMAIEALEKQIPKKVEYGTDNSWGVNKKAPVCPVCDYFLTQTYFIGDGEKITYCDHCGQKIDWSDWSEEE
jgi:hypothetical protein